MLRNQEKCLILLQQLAIRQHQRLFHQQSNVLHNKYSNVFRQGKIMGKLFGNRVSGSKKRWFPAQDSYSESSQGLVLKQSQFGQAPKSGGKNATRRMTVLNKLFMKHVTDLMATGEISESILGKGLQVSRVKISQDFAYVNVYWLTTGDHLKDAMLEHELQRCSGVLRHELSQLGLMGVVPRIKFVKDRLFTNMSQVESLLKDMDFGEEEDNEQDLDAIENYATETVKQEFYGSKTITPPAPTQLNPNKVENMENLHLQDFNLPEMRHDVLGLDHKSIMLKILTKMRKSKQAWEQHNQQNSTQTQEFNSVENFTTTPTPTPTPQSASFEQLTKLNEKLAKATANSDKFEAFLAKRKERRNTPERKKFRVSDHVIDHNSADQHDHPELIMSARQRKLYEAEDFLPEDIDNKKLN